MRNVYILVGEPEEKRHLEVLGLDGGIILIWILRKYCRVWTESICLRVGADGESCDLGNERLDSM